MRENSARSLAEIFDRTYIRKLAHVSYNWLGNTVPQNPVFWLQYHDAENRTVSNKNNTYISNGIRN